MTRFSALISVALCALFCAAFAGTAELSAPAQAASLDCPIQGPEDEPGWNWAKCGNHQRGVVTLDGNVYVVGACEFNRMWAHGAIRYTQTVNGKRFETLDPMRGDRFARSLTDCPWRIRESRPFPWHQSPEMWIFRSGI